MKLSRGGRSMPPTPAVSRSHRHILLAFSKAVAVAIFLCVYSGGNANAARDGSVIPPPIERDLATGVALAAPAGWTVLNMLLDDGTKTKAVMMREGADAQEVIEVIYQGCRDAGVADEQASNLVDKWLARQVDEQQKGYERGGFFMFERTGSKRIFERFLGGMAALAEERPFHILETGSWEGASAIWIAENILKNPASLLVCLDTWDGGVEFEDHDASFMNTIEKRFHWNMGKAPHGERVIAFKGDSLESLSVLLAKGLMSSFDAVYVDASHEMKDVLGDAFLSFRLLKVGGVMMFDDYNKIGVARAAAAFEAALGEFLTVLHKDEMHLVVTKTAEDRFASSDSELVLGDVSRLEHLGDWKSRG